MVTSGVVIAFAALYISLARSLLRLSAGSLASAGVLTAGVLLGTGISRWLARSLFDRWGTTWVYRSTDGARWGTVITICGWYVAGEGAVLSSVHPAASGGTDVCSSDASVAGLAAVAENLSWLMGAKDLDAFTPFDVLMLTAFAGLVARGDVRLWRGSAVRWRKPWLRAARRAAPQPCFTIECTGDAHAQSAIEREILEALQAKADAAASAVEPLRETGYRDAPPCPRQVHVRIEEVLRPRTLATAARALRAEPRGGAPVAVAATLAEFARRDPERMAHLRAVLREHRPRVAQA